MGLGVSTTPPNTNYFLPHRNAATHQIADRRSTVRLALLDSLLVVATQHGR
jgi:hypothetical protein